MENTSDLHVICGSGPLGCALWETLRARGRTVRLVNRGGRASLAAEAEVIAADAREPEAIRKALQGAAVVYNCTGAPYTDWPRLLPPTFEGILQATIATDARLVYADNLYAYGPVKGALHEELPYAAQGPKGRVRARLAAKLMEYHAAGKVSAAIGRASDFFGPRVRISQMGERVFAPVLKGAPIGILGRPGALHTYTFIRDFAEGLATLGEREEALGEVWHIPSAPTLSSAEFLEMVKQEAASDSAVRAAPAMLVAILGLFNPIMRELREVMYQMREPFVVDHSKYEKAFGAQVTPHKTAIRETLDWYRAQAD